EDPEILFERLGLTPYTPPATPILARVLPDSPAAGAGLHSGDKVLSVNDQAMTSPKMLVDWVQAHPDTQVQVTIERDGSRLTRDLELARTQQDGETIDRFGAAIGVDPSAWTNIRMCRQLGARAAIPAAVAKTWYVTPVTLRLMG